MGPRLLALVLAVLLAAAGGAARPAATPPRDTLVGTAEVKDLKGTVVVRG